MHHLRQTSIAIQKPQGHFPLLLHDIYFCCPRRNLESLPPLSSALGMNFKMAWFRGSVWATLQRNGGTGEKHQSNGNGSVENVGKLEAMATNSVSHTKSATFPFSRITSQTLFLKGRFFVKRRILATTSQQRHFCSRQAGVPSALLDEGLRNLPPDQRVVVRDFQTSVEISDSPNVSPSDLSF